MRLPRIRSIHPCVIEALLAGEDIFACGSAAAELMLVAGDCGSVVVASRAALSQVSMPATGVFELPTVAINGVQLRVPEIEAATLLQALRTRFEHARALWRQELPEVKGTGSAADNKRSEERQRAIEHREMGLAWLTLSVAEVSSRLPAHEMESLGELLFMQLRNGLSTVVYTWGWCLHSFGELTPEQACVGPTVVAAAQDQQTEMELQVVMKVLANPYLGSHVLWRRLWQEMTDISGPFGPSLDPSNLFVYAALRTVKSAREVSASLEALQAPMESMPGAEAVAWAAAESIERLELMTQDSFMPEELDTGIEPEEGLSKLEERWMYQSHGRQETFQQVFHQAVARTELNDPLGPVFCCNATQHLVIGAVSTVLALRFEILEAVKSESVAESVFDRLDSWVASQLHRMDGKWPVVQQLDKASIWDGVKPESVAILEPEQRNDWRAAEVLNPLLYAAIRSLLESWQVVQPSDATESVFPWITRIIDPSKPELRLQRVLVAAAPAARKWSAISEVDKQGFRHAVAKELGVSVEAFDSFMLGQPFNLQQLQVKALEIHNQPALIKPCGGLLERLKAPENFTPPWMIRALLPLQQASGVCSSAPVVKQTRSHQKEGRSDREARAGSSLSQGSRRSRRA